MNKILEFIVKFDGIFYYIFAIVCVVLIMAIMGFLMERAQKKLEKEQLAVKLNDNNSVKDDTTLITENKEETNHSDVKTINIIDFTAPSNEQKSKVMEIEKFDNSIAVNNNSVVNQNPFIPNIQGSVLSDDNVIPEIQDFTPKN